ncbi:hypothetical protein Gpo141_00002568 [Globisporangium polare]
MLPERDLKKENDFYDIQCSPQDYLPCMLRMMRAVEAHDTSVKNACPLRSNVVLKHVLIDTTSLVNLCFTKEHGTRGDYKEKGNLVNRQDITWDFFFKTEMRCFWRHGYKFDHQIVTGGVGCSILLKRVDLIGKRVLQAKNGNHETYIDEVGDYESLRRKKLVAIDPNMSDLLYLVDEFRTSCRCRCSACEQGEFKTVQKRQHLASRAGQVYDLFRAVEPRYERRAEHLEGREQ